MFGGFVLSLLCGFVPMLFLAWIIYTLDRFEKEPMALLGGVFGWGAVVAVIGALILQIMLEQSVLMLTGSEALGSMMGASLFAPVTEEILKGAVVALVFLLAHSEFDSILDGIVYAAVAALGFAATEDVLYYFSAFEEGGTGALAALFFLRFVVFGWQHAFFTAFTGIGLAVARMSPALTVKLVAPLAGLGLSILTHSLHNSLLTFLSGIAGLASAVLVAWTGWLLMAAFILFLLLRERSWMQTYLRDEVPLQTITLGQYQAACSFLGQAQARLAALLSGQYQATARFYQVCGELSHKKRQLATLGDEDGNGWQVEVLRAELGRLSSLIKS
jgi:RsiW-degrading membrane proteinase PrsW (M82 family)